MLRVTSGNFLEMYDFQVYGFYATDIARTFFPNKSGFVSLMLSLGTFGAGFLMRPLGALVLGSYMDRHGRRQGLILTLSLMALGILLIAFVPGYAKIGVLAPLLVLVGRLVQGFSAGAELGGVSVYLSEMAPPGREGFYVSWQSASQQVAVVFAALLGAALSASLSHSELARWGWRVPFLVGCLIVPFLLLIRRSLQETEAFLARTNQAGRAPDLAVTGGKLADRDAGHADGHHDHRTVLLHHVLHADLREARTAPGGDRHTAGHGLRRAVQSGLAAGDGGTVRQDRAAAPAADVHHR